MKVKERVAALEVRLQTGDTSNSSCSEESSQRAAAVAAIKKFASSQQLEAKPLSMSADNNAAVTGSSPPEYGELVGVQVSFPDDSMGCSDASDAISAASESENTSSWIANGKDEQEEEQSHTEDEARLIVDVVATATSKSAMTNNNNNADTIEEKKTDDTAMNNETMFSRIDKQIEESSKCSSRKSASVSSGNHEATGGDKKNPASGGASENPWDNLTEEGLKALQDLERVFFFTDVVDRHPPQQLSDGGGSSSIIRFSTGFAPPELNLEKVYTDVYDSSMGAYNEFKKTSKEVERKLFFTDVPDAALEANQETSEENEVCPPSFLKDVDPNKVYSEVYDSSIGAYKEVKKTCKEVERTLFFTDLPESSPSCTGTAEERPSKEVLFNGDEVVQNISTLTDFADKVPKRSDHFDVPVTTGSTNNNTVPVGLQQAWKNLEKTFFFTDLDDEALKREYQLDTMATEQEHKMGQVPNKNSNLNMCSDISKAFCFTDLNGKGRQMLKHHAKNQLMDQVMAEENRANFQLPQELQQRLDQRMEQVRHMQRSSSSKGKGSSSSATSKSSIGQERTVPVDTTKSHDESAQMTATQSQEGVDNILLNELVATMTMESPLVSMRTSTSQDEEAAEKDQVDTTATEETQTESEEAPDHNDINDGNSRFDTLLSQIKKLETVIDTDLSRSKQALQKNQAAQHRAAWV